MHRIIAGRRSITGGPVLRRGHWFWTDPQFGLNLQAQFDLVEADKETGEAMDCGGTRRSEDEAA